MQFKYPIFYQLVFRYGNFLATILLIFYLIPIALSVDKNLWLLIPLAVILIVIYIINRRYLTLYKILPFNIEADDEKLIFTNFFFSGRESIIFYKNINSLSGGIFEGKWRGLMKVCDGKNMICIGFYDKINNSEKLVTLILSKVDKKIYDQVIEKIQILRNPHGKSQNNS